MAAARLQQRIPSAIKLGLVTLPGHRLTFDNCSTKDGSGKCDALVTGAATDFVIAVLYVIDGKEKPILDHYEGLGIEYRDAFIQIETPKGEPVDALIYYATNLMPNVKPYQWYKEHVLRGARENGFPEDYIDSIIQVESVIDTDHQRTKREVSIHHDPLE